jgi:MoaA/NifB/PqqE/SkfB family radical SAM enzyme
VRSRSVGDEHAGNDPRRPWYKQGDPRMKQLRVVSPGPSPRLPLPAEAEVRFEEGFHPEEQADGLPFRWMTREARLSFDPPGEEGFLEVWAWSAFHDLSQTITVTSDGRPPCEHTLVHGWNQLSTPIPPGAATACLQVNRAYPVEWHPADPRELAVQIRLASLRTESARHDHVTGQHANSVLNAREMLEGRVELSSTPPKLGIDIAGTCNVKPPCVYCPWDDAKALEGEDVSVPFDLDTLDAYGPFFENAVDLINCSIGEPFMMRNVDELLDAFGRRGKVLELTTNGQILTDSNIEKLLGRSVRLYISLDAATPETYSRLRNDTFPRLLDNVRRLVRAKGGRGKMPHVYLVFMPMKANVHEVDAFVRLVADLGADRLVLRPLNRSEGEDLVWDRAGYRFVYRDEMLPFEQLVEISGRVAELCTHHGVELSDQMDFGGAFGPQFQAVYEEGRRRARASLSGDVHTPQEPRAPGEATPAPEAAPPSQAPPPPRAKPSLGAERLPACREPWSTLYVLRRGTLPCCYGGKPVAPMSGFKEAWNSPLVRDIRRELSQGRFHQYCFESPTCPIVQKASESHALGGGERLRLSLTRMRERWARAGYGWLGAAYRMAKRRYKALLGGIRRIGR